MREGAISQKEKRRNCFYYKSRSQHLCFSRPMGFLASALVVLPFCSRNWNGTEILLSAFSTAKEDGMDGGSQAVFCALLFYRDTTNAVDSVDNVLCCSLPSTGWPGFGGLRGWGGEALTTYCNVRFPNLKNRIAQLSKGLWIG